MTLGLNRTRKAVNIWLIRLPGWKRWDCCKPAGYVAETDDYMYEYELMPPLSPADFFATQHLTLLLRDKIGKFAVLSLREQFWNREPEEWSRAIYGKRKYFAALLRYF